MANISIPNFENVDIAPPRLDPGEYMMNIPEKPEIKSSEDGSKQYLEVKLKVLDGPEQVDSDPGTGSKSPVGRVVTDRYYLTEKAAFRIKALLIAAGILSRDDKDSAVAKGQFNSDVLAGAKFPVNVTIQMRDGKEYRNYDPVV